MTMLKSLLTVKGISIVIVSHDMDQVAEYADRVVVMERGEKIMDGKPYEVFARQQELKNIGLEIPFGLKLLFGLKNVNVDVDTQVCRKIDICGELLKLRE